ncbi:Small auxin-up RNA - like 10 [Theobroma cacao]|nr:Small auxin-up RNA - like 10 [Theobroma cacao]
MVVFSLILQLVLVMSGDLRRKYIGKALPYVAMMVWLVYLLADWMATLVLSTLLRGDVKLKNELIVFWAPFLLWHLGSPHNVTAYSLEDNEMWLRHFLGMVFQVLEAVYIYVRFRSDTDLNLMAVPIFLAGVWKYGERIWALRSASDKQLMNSLAQREQATPEENIIRFRLPESQINDCFEAKGNVSELKLLREAYSSFLIFKPLFLGVPVELSAKFYDDMVFINSKSAEEAFKLVGTELKFLYDLFFTKMPLHHNHQKVSLSLRALCFLSAVSLLIAFSAIVDKSVHSKVDIVITYLLLLGAISLDAYSFIMHLLSIWSMIWLPVPKNTVQKMYSKVVASRWHLVEAKMAIKSMAQHDIINYYVEANAIKLYDAVKIIDTGNHLQKDWHTKWKPIDCELKQFIYDHLKEERGKLDEKDFGPEDLKKLLNAPFFEDLEEDTTDFSQSKPRTMSSKKLNRMAWKWQQMTVMGRKRISFQGMANAKVIAGSDDKSSVAEKGHFVIYTTDQKRRVFPLAYLSSNK